MRPPFLFMEVAVDSIVDIHYLTKYNEHMALKRIIRMDTDDPHEYPIDGTLDLHQFAPGETKDVVREYIRVCIEKGILRLRIVHGKGTGVQREIVRSLLSSHADVVGYRHESGSGGGWGATVVDLRG